MNMVKLESGKTVPQFLVVTTMIALDNLVENAPLEFFELVSFCRDSNYQIKHDVKSKALLLLQPDGSVNDDVKEIVLAATEGEGLDLKLTKPRLQKG